MIDAEEIRDFLEDLKDHIENDVLYGYLEEMGGNASVMADNLKTDDDRLEGMAAYLKEAANHLYEATECVWRVTTTIENSLDMDDEELENPETMFN